MIEGLPVYKYFYSFSVEHGDLETNGDGEVLDNNPISLDELKSFIRRAVDQTFTNSGWELIDWEKAHLRVISFNPLPV